MGRGWRRRTPAWRLTSCGCSVWRLLRHLDTYIRDVKTRRLQPLGGKKEGIASLPHANGESLARLSPFDRLRQKFVVWEGAPLAPGEYLIPDFPRRLAPLLRLDQGRETHRHDDNGFAHRMNPSDSPGSGCSAHHGC